MPLISNTHVHGDYDHEARSREGEVWEDFLHIATTFRKENLEFYWYRNVVYEVPTDFI